MLDAIGPSTTATLPPQMRVLNTTEAALVWLLKWSGDADHVIAAKLGTMPSKVSDILAENTHLGSKDQATRMMYPKKVQ